MKCRKITIAARRWRYNFTSAQHAGLAQGHWSSTLGALVYVHRWNRSMIYPVSEVKIVLCTQPWKKKASYSEIIASPLSFKKQVGERRQSGTSITIYSECHIWGLFQVHTWHAVHFTRVSALEIAGAAVVKESHKTKNRSLLPLIYYWVLLLET